MSLVCTEIEWNRERFLVWNLRRQKADLFKYTAMYGLSDAVGPDKLLWDGVFGDLTEFIQEGSLLKVDVETVTEAVVRLADELVLINSERVEDFASTLLVARDGSLSDLLGETCRQEGLLDLLLLSLQLFKWHLGVLFHLFDTTY